MNAKQPAEKLVEEHQVERKQLSGDERDMLVSFVRRYDEKALVEFVEQLLNRGSA